MHIKGLVRIFSVISLIVSCSVWAQESNDENNVVDNNEYSVEASSVKSKYQCELRGNVRRVEIQYTDSTSAIPCVVMYYKDTESPGTERVLWSATNEVGYCETKAQEFVEKLENWGWNCQ
jgi:hypothetical protein